VLQVQSARIGQNQRNPKQHKYRYGSALHQVLDARFQGCRLAAVKSHQQVRRNSHRLEPDPQVEQVAGAPQANDHADHRQEHGIVFFFTDLISHIGARENHHQRAQPQRQPGQQQAQTIHLQPNRADLEIAEFVLAKIAHRQDVRHPTGSHRQHCRPTDKVGAPGEDVLLYAQAAHQVHQR